MGLGDTAKKVQRVTKIAEETYERLNQLVGQIQDLRERVERTGDQIESIDRELAEQRAIVEALADEQGIDVDEVVAQVAADDGAETGTAGEEKTTTADGDDDAADGDGAVTVAGGDAATGTGSSDETDQDDRN